MNKKLKDIFEEYDLGSLVYEFWNGKLKDIEADLFKDLFIETARKRRKIAMENLERLIAIFKPKENYFINDKETLYSLINNLFSKKYKIKLKEVYIKNTSLDMRLYTELNDQRIPLIISRVKTLDSITDKIFRKKIVGLSKDLKNTERDFYMFGVLVLCKNEDERKKIFSNIRKHGREYNIIKKRIFIYNPSDSRLKRFREEYKKRNLSLKPTIIKTAGFEIPTDIEDVKVIEPNYCIIGIVSKDFEEKIEAKLKNEIKLNDIGGMYIVLDVDDENKFYRASSDIIKELERKARIKVIETRDYFRNAKSTGYRAIHFIVSQGKVPDMNEIKVARLGDFIMNEFKGRFSSSHYKYILPEIDECEDKRLKELYHKIKLSIIK